MRRSRPLLVAFTGLALAAVVGAAATPRGTEASASLCLDEPERGSFASWPVTASEELEAGPFATGYGVRVLRSGTLDRGTTAAVSNLCPLRDFVLEVDAQLAEPGQAGYAIQLRRRSDEDYLTLLVDAERRLASLYRRADGRSTVLWGWAPVEALHGATTADRIKARLFGSRVSVEVNGVALFDLEAAGPDRGSLWLGAVTWGQPSRTIFSNLVLTAPD